MKMHPLSIKRAVANMVVNAARYGNGWIKVSSGTESHRARFQVEDDGPGIKPEQRKHLFQPFVRGDSARSTSGTGLGLAIVQRIIDNHNGMLEIGTSERGGLSIRARYRFLWLASGGRQRGIRKGGITLPFFSTPDDAVQSRHPACSLQLRSGANQRFACRGIRILLEVLNEQFRQRGGFFLPLFRRRVGVTRVENVGIHARSSVGIARSNSGRRKVSALSREPFRMASIIARVSLMEIRLPVPFQPVLTR